MLVKHAIKHITPIHGSAETIPQVTAKFRENAVPPFAYFFKNQTLSITVVPPTRYISWAISRTMIKRNSNVIMELNLGVSKRGLYKEYTYLHGWKIKHQPIKTIMKTALVGDDEESKQPQTIFLMVVLSSILEN